MHNYKKLMLGLVLSTAASGALAQEQMEGASTYRGSWSASGEVINFDPAIAAYNGIDDSGLGMGFGYSGEKGLFNFNVGLSFFFIDDEAEFSQRVENDWSGDESTEESSIDAGSVYIDAGVQTPLTVSHNFLIGLNAGYRYFDIDRSISYCRDCYSEDVSVDSDTYLKPFARFAFTDRASGTLAYYRYTGDKGAEDSLQFGMNFRF